MYHLGRILKSIRLHRGLIVGMKSSWRRNWNMTMYVKEQQKYDTPLLADNDPSSVFASLQAISAAVCCTQRLDKCIISLEWDTVMTTKLEDELTHLSLRYKDTLSRSNVNGDTMYMTAVVCLAFSEIKRESSMHIMMI